MGGQRLLELADAELEPLRPGLIHTGRLVLESAAKVVEDRQQTSDQLR